MPSSSNTYLNTPEEFFAILQKSMESESTKQAYSTLNRVFCQFVCQETDFKNLRLPGIFARTNHLIQDKGIDNDLALRINDTRVRLKDIFSQDLYDAKSIKEEKLQKTLTHDLKAVCEFISAVSNTELPLSLRASFPTSKIGTTKGKSKKESVRVMVQSWDDEYIHAIEDSNDCKTLKICYSHNNKYLKGGDWSYLSKLLKQGCQLNLVAVREKEGILLPELIVVEPDILIDVSSVAACMEHYGDSPYSHLLNRLRPNEHTKHTILGNLASALLDNALQEDQKSYKECATEFFRRNAIQITTTPLGIDFHTSGQQQKTNIENLLNTDSEEGQVTFDKQKLMVEPTFFCEMLGLQGRMDLLSLDYSLLLEQKSGKGAFMPSSDPTIPIAQEKHYAQMILYMAILHYNFAQKNANAYLLYSKYPKGLLGLGPAPELLYRAMRLRNQLAWMERQSAEEGFLRNILENLTPDRLNVNKTTGTLWERYTKPQIDSILRPIHTATPLQRDYYYRMLQFMFAEHLLGKIGVPGREDYGFASKWHETLESKVSSGNIYYNLLLETPHKDHEGTVETLVFKMTNETNGDTSNFRKGDIVVVFSHKRNTTPDVRKSIVFRCNIEDITATHITLRLRAPQSSARVFHMQKGDSWCIEHDYYESSLATLTRALHAFLSCPPERRELILSQRQPATDPTKRLNLDHGDKFNNLMLKVKQAQDLFLIVGPPGTGKTSFGMLNTLKEELSDPNTSVLLLSYTNRAVDEICSKLVSEGIDFIRIGGHLTCSDECRPYLLESKSHKAKNKEELHTLLTSTRVYAGTTSSINSHTEIFKLKSFSLAIIDEASQILDPHIIGLLSSHTNGKPHINKFVLIGDHKQLPAVVRQDEAEAAITTPSLRAIGLTDCRQSFFERTYQLHRDNPQVCQMLTYHGRMHEDIATFPNQSFYNGQLQAVPLPHQTAPLPVCQTTYSHPIADKVFSNRVAFIHVPPQPVATPSDKVNLAEAELIAQLAVKAYETYKDTFHPDKTIGIIVPYRNQIAAVRNSIQAHGIPSLHNISIDTVERFQGSQRNVIIYGFTVRHRYQLNFLCSNTFLDGTTPVDRKLNVVMTRAIDRLILVGNTTLLSQSPVFTRLITYAKTHNAYFVSE